MNHVDKAWDGNEKKNKWRREKSWFYKSPLILSQPIMINLPRGTSGPCIHIIFQLFTRLSSSFLGDLLLYMCVYLHKWLLEKTLVWVVVLILGFLLPMADSSSASYIHMVICLYDSRTPYVFSKKKKKKNSVCTLLHK